MTPNGAIIFALVVVVDAMLAQQITSLAVLFALCVAFGLIETRDRLPKALIWSAAIVAPLALFLVVIWVGMVGRSPTEMAAGATGTRAAALLYVLTICLRLFVVALVVQLVVLRFAHLTPLQFVRVLAAPLVVKKLIVLTLSWIDTLLHAIDRSRTALVTAGVIAPRLSLRNMTNGWVLVQTVWLSVITIAVGRLRDKWPAENTVAQLDRALDAPALPLARADWLWLAAFAAAVLMTQAV